MDSILIEAARQWICAGSPEQWPCANLHEPGLRGLFFAGVPFRGRPTRVFAWLGLPDSAGERQQVPGVVLVHGGGGTAFARWVRWWCARGFAAIAIDTCGAQPLPDTGALGSADWPRHNHAGPPGWGSFNQAEWPLEDQWVFHAAAAIVKARLLLADDPAVDADRIGITGISWGGFLACLAVGIDSGFRCAAPVYGCGFVSEASIWTQNGSFSGMSDAQFGHWNTHWDPASVLHRAHLPMLWINGSNDFAYWPPSWHKSALATAGPRQLCFKLRWPHGHIPAAEQAGELECFFRHHLLGEPGPLTLGTPNRSGRHLQAAWSGSRAVRCAGLLVTQDRGPWPERQWHLLPARLDRAQHSIEAELPETWTAAALSLLSEDWLYSTSDLIFRD